MHGETYNLYNRSIGVLGSSILHEATIFDRVMELDIRMMGSTKLRYLEWFPSVVEANCVHQTGARYSLTNLETSCGYSSPTTVTIYGYVMKWQTCGSQKAVEKSVLVRLRPYPPFFEKAVDIRG